MNRIWAIATVTFKEAARKRVFLVLVLFAVALLVSSLFLPAMDLAARTKLIQGWGLKSIGLFGALIAIFLAGVSLPEDIEDRKLFTLITKPLSRLDVVIGKTLGFALVELVFFVAISAMCILYIRTTVALSDEPSKDRVLQFRDRVHADLFEFRSPEGTESWAEGRFTAQKRPGEQHELSATLGGMTWECFLWRFLYVEDVEVGGYLHGQLRLKLTTQGVGGYGGIVVRYINPFTGEELFDRFHVTYNQPVNFKVPWKLISDRRILVVGVSPTDPRAKIEADPASMFLWTAPGSFEWNFVKATGLLFLQIVLLAVAVVMGSTLLSAPVNIFFGFFFYVAGSLVAFLGTSIRTVESTIAMLAIHAPVDHCHQEELPIWALQASKEITRFVIGIIPDLGRFDAASYIMKDLNVPLHLVGDGLAYGVGYVVIFLFLSWLFIRLREFK